MKVAYLLRYYPTLTETFVYGEAAGLAARGVEVRLLSLGDRPDGALADGLPRLPHQRLRRRPWGRWLREDSAGERFVAAHSRDKDADRLGALKAAASGVDRLHVHFAGEAAELAHGLFLDEGTPYSVMVHAVDLYKPRPSARAVLQAADLVFAVSDHTAALTARLADRPVLRLRCGPDLGRFRPSPPPPGPLRALFVGRDVPKKGLDTLLAAWPQVGSSARLTVVSDRRGPAPAGVRLLGLAPPSALPALIAQHHLLVLPCRRAPDGDQDGVPLVLMEALATGRPALSTPVSGIPELLGPEVGWLAPPDDPSALGGLLAALTVEDCAARGAAGPAWLRRQGFTLDAQVSGLLSAWEAQGR